jgi:hypothetical protein
MNLVDNERIKLLANAFDRASTACFTVGIATTVAGFVYSIGGFRGTIGYSTMALSLAGWFVVAVGLHLYASRLLKRLQP